MKTGDVALQIFCAAVTGRDLNTLEALQAYQVAWDMAEHHKRVVKQHLAADNET